MIEIAKSPKPNLAAAAAGAINNYSNGALIPSHDTKRESNGDCMKKKIIITNYITRVK